MTANFKPLQGLTGDLSRDNGTTKSALVTAAANVYDGSDGDEALVHTAGANGSFVKAIRCEAAGTNVVTVARVYVKLAASNFVLIAQMCLPATTASATAPTPAPRIPLGIKLKNGDSIYVAIATLVAAGWYFNAEAEQY